VLRGTADTLARNRPTVLVEAEERHHPNAVTRDHRVFRRAEHQHPANIGGWKDGWEARGVYVNNFVFVPKGV
jgi:hypothetical protein